MFGFALALALPFTLFAMFPSWMNALPKSGGWLNSVKIVLGFLEIALALKFLSNVDLAYHWQWFDREIFLTLWIAIFALLTLYLLGKIQFSHDSPVAYLSVPRLFLAIISLAFTVYMVPGLWGAPLDSIAAFYHHNIPKISICTHKKLVQTIHKRVSTQFENMGRFFMHHSILTPSLTMRREWPTQKPIISLL
jgi:thiol:disulfide interchange protein